jgi:hypothetical protein
MPTTVPDQIAERRRIEEALKALGAEREYLEHVTSMNRQKIRALLKPAREVDISLRDVADMTGLSTQALHTWMRELMRPILPVHLGLRGPAPTDLAEAVLRTMGGEPERDWTASEVRAAIPARWPTGSTHEVQLALGMLSRSLQIWQTDDGYRIAPPPDTDMLSPSFGRP